METPAIPPVQRTAALIGAVSGALLIVSATADHSVYANTQSLLGLPLRATLHDSTTVAYAAAPIVAAVAGLLLLRRWPLLLVAAALVTLPTVLPAEWEVRLPAGYTVLTHGTQVLVVVALLGAAQAMLRRGETGRGTLVAGLVVAAPLLGTALISAWALLDWTALLLWHRALVLIALAGVVPAAWLLKGHDPAARPDDEPGRRWPWLRLVLAAGGALALVFPLGLLTTERLAALLGVSQSAMYRHGYAEEAVIGVITLVVVAGLAAMAGPWPLGGALTAATVQVGLLAPMTLAMGALQFTSMPVVAVAAGLAAGAALAWGRHRFPLTAAVTVAAATALFIAYAATTGHPEKLASQRSVIPGILIAVLVTAAVTAAVGCIATTLAPTAALPATLGPLAGVMALAGQHAVASTYLPNSLTSNSVNHLTTSAVLLLVAAAGVGGLGFAQQWATRRADRLRAEQIRREAAEAERNRLARPIHDGVLQVLALMQRHGTELGGAGPRLATLAGEQEVALRSLLSGNPAAPPTGAGPDRLDLRSALTALASATVEVAGPADPVLLPGPAAAELTAAVQAALDNVRHHAGPTARAWVLLEDEGDAVRVTVRDDGVGFAPERLAEAADAGRLGVAQSMRGRITDLGGTTEIHSRPGRGTEVEFHVPRRP
ncbi:ATP-binding protein [Dactylosporangium sp. CA-233914]|uniref:ATP-binding protein n=1 Tax=Dactylosporangium sp. CA-233914 TaxID=3239934 RepID=UPI003D9256B9